MLIVAKPSALNSVPCPFAQRRVALDARAVDVPRALRVIHVVFVRHGLSVVLFTCRFNTPLRPASAMRENCMRV